MVFSQSPVSDYILPSQSELGVRTLLRKARIVGYLGGIRPLQVRWMILSAKQGRGDSNCQDYREQEESFSMSHSKNHDLGCLDEGRCSLTSFEIHFAS
jgi:hypothetical protein